MNLENDAIIIDTREKPRAIKKIVEWFDANGIRHVSSKLYCGDYQLLSNGKAVIDRKQGLMEICGNLTQQHDRFRREAERARDLGIRLIVLVEDGDKVKSLDDVKRWINPRIWTYCKQYGISTKGNLSENIREFVAHGGRKPPQDGEWLYKAMSTMAERYGIVWEFCSKQDTGRRIVELLTEYAENRL